MLAANPEQKEAVVLHMFTAAGVDVMVCLSSLITAVRVCRKPVAGTVKISV